MDLSLRLPSLYGGTHLALPEVASQRAAAVEVEAARSDTNIWIEVDGEPLGRLPARFEVLPHALSLRGADA